jgi:hypothetical protein
VSAGVSAPVLPLELPKGPATGPEDELVLGSSHVYAGKTMRRAATAVRRPRGTGSLLIRTDKAGRETWYGKYRVGPRQVMKRLGVRRRQNEALVRLQKKTPLLEELYRGERSRLLAFFSRRVAVSADAEDLVHETFLREPVLQSCF